MRLPHLDNLIPRWRAADSYDLIRCSAPGFNSYLSNVRNPQLCYGWMTTFNRKNARAFPAVLAMKVWVIPLPESVIAFQAIMSLDHSAP